jgi:hypothetical protein
MARLVRFDALKLKSRRKADLEFALQRFSDAEVGDYVNDGIAEYYDLLIRSSRGGNRLFENQFTITTDGLNTFYALPSDFYDILHAQANIGNNGTIGDTNIPIRGFTMAERAELSSSTPGWAGQPFSYMLHGGTQQQAGTTQGTIPTQYAIELLPKPAAQIKVLLFYIPSCPLLVQDGDTLDSINGWDQYVAIWAAIEMRQKDDLDTGQLEGKLAAMRERIEALVPHRDRIGPSRVTDVRQQWPAWAWRRRRTA